MTSLKKIMTTKNYRLFHRHSDDNRPLDLKKHKKLIESMKRYGFLRCFPIVVYREKKNGDRLIVKDGQHRLAIAETLGLPVYWVEEEIDFDVAFINGTPKGWELRDYAQKYATNGVKAYQEGMDFAEQYGLPLSMAFALLAGTTTFTNCYGPFEKGEFKVRDRKWAESVAGVYVPLVQMSPAIKNKRLVEAVMAVCRVPEFDGKRLLAGAERCREKLVPYSTRDAYLDMMEAVYNFGRKQLVGLKAAAMMAMRDRSAAGRPPEKRQKKDKAA